jgi:hypothetical protein
MRAGLGLLQRIAEEIRTTGTYRTLEGAVSHKDLNDLLGG